MTSSLVQWEFEAFIKLARLGAICLLPTRGGKYLLQDDAFGRKIKTRLRPPGGGKEPEDKDLNETIVRELHEEFGLSEEEIKDKVKFLGFTHQRKYWGTPVYLLKGHGLKPGVYQASNCPDEKVKLVEVSLDHPNYTGPDPSRLITEDAKKFGDKLIAKEASELYGKLERHMQREANPPGHGQRFMNTGHVAPHPRMKKRVQRYHLISPLEAEKSACIACDLDGTLAQHDDSKPFDPKHIGEPVPAMLEKVKRWLKDGKEVIIFTARASDPKHIPPIKAWLKKHDLGDLEVTNSKLPEMEEFWDDKAVAIEKNTGREKSAADFEEDLLWLSDFEKESHIRAEGGKYVLYTHDGKKRLGTHGSHAEALAQERAIQAHKHASEKVVGIPDRSDYGDITQLPLNQLLPYVVQEHQAQRAGKHYDIRFGDKSLHSFASRKGLPGPGERRLLIEQPLHAQDYAEFQGNIQSGYGAGEVRTHDKGHVLVTKAEPNQLDLVLSHKKYPEYVTLRRTEGKNWLAINHTPMDPVKFLGSEEAFQKPRMKTAQPEEEDDLVKNHLVSAKLSGASNLFKLGPKGVDVASYRVSKKDQRPIIHTERVGDVSNLEIPENLHGTILRGELYGEREPNAKEAAHRKTISETELGGLLNSSVARSLQEQKKRGVKLKAAIFDIVGFQGKPAERRARIQDILKHLPADKFSEPPYADTSEQAKAMIEQIRSGEHPMTDEGVVAWPHEGGPAKKLKNFEESDVYYRGFAPGKGRLVGRGAGAVLYSHQPGGEPAGEVGSGLDDLTREDIVAHPEEYLDRVMKVRHRGKQPSGALFQPTLLGFHEDPREGIPQEVKQAAANAATLFSQIIGGISTRKRQVQGGGMLPPPPAVAPAGAPEPMSQTVKSAAVDYGTRLERLHERRGEHNVIETPDCFVCTICGRAGGDGDELDGEQCPGRPQEKVAFHKPENWDKHNELSTKEYRIWSGANDWESAMTAAAVTMGNDEYLNRVWIETDPPKEIIKHDEWNGNWGRHILNKWVERAKEMRAARAKEMGLEQCSWSLDDWYNAADGLEGVTDFGRETTEWHDKKASALTSEQMAAVPTTGPEAIAYALRNVDLDKKEAEAKTIIARKLKSKRPDAIRMLGYLDGFKRTGLKPADLLINKVPVIPPQFRPYTVAGDVFVPGDANELYRDLINLKDLHGELEQRLGKSGAGFNRLNIYDAVKAVYGYGNPTSPKTRERGVSGFLKKLTGSSPKFSYVQRRLIGRNLDYVGRGVIAVDPDLGLDEIGIPEDMLWKQYSPYVQRRLVRHGMKMEQAVKSIEDRDEHASKMLDLELKERPVMYTRDPAWHKFNAIGGWPKRIQGSTIMINPLTTSGLGADFDGDQIGVHVPSLDSAVDDVKTKLMPSKMLFSIKDQNKVVPVVKHEQVLGLAGAQMRPAKNTWSFPSEAEALKAIKAGQIRLSDEVNIGPPTI